ncbi:AAA family ATPase [Halorarum halophilum]|uniref:AAA family ATPase n=1 Tax=Halorarum halophilum TaxID=2743090 RepID=A0A7D5GYG1_9EURY|nr:AAA family ATPase [Halobaculum halophilum]QLG28549.1 AAA family ATPase [Halobaculum halophilum]
MTRTIALVGVAGGVGTTRTAVECAATLARDGRDVAVLDAAYATQGLSEFVAGRIDPDLTGLCLAPGRPLEDGLYDLPLDEPGTDDPERDDRGTAVAPGRVALAPALAPFERLARAKTIEAAEAFEDRVAEAAGEFDHVILDTPPVAANQHLAAVDAADRVVLVASGSEHGVDARRRMIDRLADVGAAPEHTVAVGEPIPSGDATLPRLDAAPADGARCPRDEAVGADTAAAVEALFGVELDLTFEPAGALDRLREGVGGIRGRAEE